MSNRFGLENLAECESCGVEMLDCGNASCLTCLGEIAEAAAEGDSDDTLDAEPLTFNGRDW